MKIAAVIRVVGLCMSLLVSAAYSEILRAGYFEAATRTLLVIIVLLLATDAVAKVFEGLDK